MADRQVVKTPLIIEGVEVLPPGVGPMRLEGDYQRAWSLSVGRDAYKMHVAGVDPQGNRPVRGPDYMKMECLYHSTFTHTVGYTFTPKADYIEMLWPDAIGLAYLYDDVSAVWSNGFPDIVHQGTHFDATDHWLSIFRIWGPIKKVKCYQLWGANAPGLVYLSAYKFREYK